MQNPTIRNHPFITLIAFLATGFVVSQLASLSSSGTLYCLLAFFAFGLLTLACEIQDRQFSNWQRPISSVLTMERPAAPTFRGNPDDVILHNLKANVWYGHAAFHANSWQSFKDENGDRVVVAHLGDQPIGMFISDDKNWFVISSGESV